MLVSTAKKRDTKELRHQTLYSTRGNTDTLVASRSSVQIHRWDFSRARGGEKDRQYRRYHHLCWDLHLLILVFQRFS